MRMSWIDWKPTSTRRGRVRGWPGVLATGALVAASIVGGHAQSAVSPTAQLLSELIRIDTSNPPGNEGRIARMLEPRFAALGFQVDVIPTPQEGKAHFIARLKGNGSARPILLAAHADVVGVEREKWTFDPFGGAIADGYVFGRGAIDFKGGLAVFARAVMMLAEQRVPLARDVIFLVEADEEGGSYGTSWLAERHWDKIACEFALNEGGWIIKGPDGGVRYVSISTGDKVSVSMVVTAKGTSTHSSMPRSDNAIFTLAKALAKLGDYETEPHLIPITREFFGTLARTSPEPLAGHFRDLVSSSDPARVRQADRAISADPLLHAIMRNTIAPVMMNAGFRYNVIPGSAEATINVRLIPGVDATEMAAEISRVIGDPAVDVRILPSAAASRVGSGAPVSSTSAPPPVAARGALSPQDTALYRALVEQAGRVYPGALVTPYLFQAGTDAGAWRSRGVPVYGIYPYPIDHEDLSRMHGNDERVSVSSLDSGTALIFQTLVAVAGAR